VKSVQSIVEVGYDVTELLSIRWNSTGSLDGYASACCDPDLWLLTWKPNRYVSMPKYIVTWFWWN